MNYYLIIQINIYMTAEQFPIFKGIVSFHYTIVDITHACTNHPLVIMLVDILLSSEVWSPKKDMRTALCGLCTCGELGPENQESITNPK